MKVINLRFVRLEIVVVMKYCFTIQLLNSTMILHSFVT